MMRQTMTRMAACALALAAGACAMPGNREPPPQPFTGTRWELVMEIPLPGEPPFVRFGDGRAEGFGGCSRFAARYVQDAVGARAIAVGRIEVDRRLCDTSRAMAESRMLEVLQSVSSYSVTADVLTMSGSGGTLRFRAAVDAPSRTASPLAPAVPLAGTRWRGVVGAGVEPTAVPWLEFSEGRVAGYTGCNMLSGGWRNEGGAIKVGPLVTTKRGCTGPAADLERKLLEALNERSSLTREGAKLEATAPGGARFEFEEIK